MHLDGDHAVPLTGFAPSALDVERKASWLEAARLGLRHHREQLADEREHAGIGRRVRARRASDRRLIDLDDLVDQRDAVDALVRAGLGGRAIDRLGQRAIEDVVDQRRLARAADTGDRGQRAERNRDVDVLQIVGARAADDDLALRRGPSRRRRRNRALAAQIRAGQRAMAVLQQLGGLTLENHVAAVLAGARTEIDHVVGRADRLLVVLDHDDGVTEIARAASASPAACGCRADAGRSTARRARRARR